MNVKPYAKRFFLCAACGEHEFQVEHVMAKIGTTYWWVCDECGVTNDLTVNADGSLNVLTGTRPRRPRILAVVKLVAPADSVYAVVEAYSTEGETPAETFDHARYWLEVHTCPTNPTIREFIVNGDTDPHGMWKLIGIAPNVKQGGRDTREITDYLAEVAPDLHAIVSVVDDRG